MGKKDITLKQVLTDPIKFADLFNATIFKGRKVLDPKNLIPLPNESSIIIKDKDGKRKSVQRFRDVVKMAAFGTEFIILAYENQSEVHYTMPVRNMLYDALDYTEQVQSIGREHKANGDYLKPGAEFLSKYKKNDKITPVFSLIVYYGKDDWDASIDLHGMMNFPENIEPFKEYIPNYKMNILHVQNVDDLEVYTSSLREIFGMLKFASDKEQMKKYVMANKERFTNLDEETYTAILILLDERRYLEKMKEKLKPEEGGKYDMCLAFEQMIEEGKKEGIELSNIDKIRKKIQKGYDSDIIADHLELDIEYVEKIIQLIQKSPQETNNQITKRILVNSY